MSPISVNVRYVQGTPEGCIHIEEQRVIIYQIPHDFVPSLVNEEELKRAGIYILVSETNKTVYVGQADARDNGNGVLARVLEPHTKKAIAEWEYAYIMVSSTPTFLGSTQLDWLEQYFYDKVQTNKRYSILNGNRPHAADVSYSTRTQLEDFTSIVLFLLQQLTRCDVFVEKKTKGGSQVLQYIGPLVPGLEFFITTSSNKYKAKGIISGPDKRITVKEGSSINPVSHLANQKGQTHGEVVRTQLISDGVVKNFVFVKDYEFPNTSIAAAVITGSSASGPDQWKDANGIQLKAYMNK